MVFPTTILPITVELYLGGTWVDVTGDVQRKERITIGRGRARESAQVDPGWCRFTLKNPDDHYNPRNASGPYFGDLGRNTPCRVGITRASDAYGRTVTEGWGTADLGGNWSTINAGGVISGTDTSVSSGTGKHSVPAVSSHRANYLAGAVHGNVDVAVTVTLAIANVLGGDLEPANLMVRGVSITDYYMARVVITSTETITLGLMHYDGTVIAAPITIAGITHAAGQALRVRVQVEDQTMRAKVWVVADGEPYDWDLTAQLPEGAARTGWVGVRSGVSAGNTNTKPIVFTYDDFVAGSPRFNGELSSLQQRWDTSGKHRWVDVETGSVLRRIGQGTSPLRSSLYRGLSGHPNLVAYWPAEDEGNAAQIASGLSGDPAMTLSGNPDFEAEDGFDCSAPLPSLQGSILTGEVPSYTGTGDIQVRWLMHMPAAEAAGAVLARVECTGTAPRWDFTYGLTPGRLRLRAYDNTGTQILDSLDVSFAESPVEGNYMWMSLELNQNGANIDWAFATLQVGSAEGLAFNGTLNSRTVTTAQKITMNPTGSFVNTVMGHIAVESAIDNLFDADSELEAWVGETAAARLQRLCDEESIDLEFIGDPDDTVRMGPQLPNTLIDLFNECAKSDMGTLSEARGRVALVYRTRASLYNQTAGLTLDYSANQLAKAPRQTDDDQTTRNDVTAKRLGGSSYQLKRETGRLSVLPPAEGGVGVYDTIETVNVRWDSQLPDIASWLRHLGTVDEARYPVLPVNLARPGNSGLIDTMLSLGLDDRVLLQNMTADDIDMLARGSTETIAQKELEIDLNCVPGSPWQVLTLNAAGHKIGSRDSKLAVGINSSATSLSVTVPGTLWTTVAGEMPISITIGGEVMSVTAISGATSPQTFTVTRSINGVAKSHAAGAPIWLTRRPTIAL